MSSFVHQSKFIYHHSFPENIQQKQISLPATFYTNVVSKFKLYYHKIKTNIEYVSRRMNKILLIYKIT